MLSFLPLLTFLTSVFLFMWNYPAVAPTSPSGTFLYASADTLPIRSEFNNLPQTPAGVAGLSDFSPTTSIISPKRPTDTSPPSSSSSPPSSLSSVTISRPSPRSRRITARITVDARPSTVWSVLTDYDNLAEHVPNLVESRMVPHTDMGPGRRRLYQAGIGKVLGVDVRAELTMDVAESPPRASSDASGRVVAFTCVDSRFFETFDGSWTVGTGAGDAAAYGRRSSGQTTTTTTLEYVVHVRPRGRAVPVKAVEWRVRGDVTANLEAVKAASERRERGGSTT